MAARKVAQVREAGEEAKASAKSVVIEQPKVSLVALEVEGVTPLIQNNFSQKSIEQMLRKHMGMTVVREKKKPRDLIEQAKILNMDKRICIPPTAFKKGMLTASALTRTFKKTQLRTSIFIEGQSVPITFKSETPRMDMVRTGGMSRAPDVRFRPMFSGWKARLVLQFSDLISVQSAVDLLNRAGSVGVGEWRPEKDGTFGTYRVSRHITAASEIAEVRAQCAVSLVPLYIPEWALDADIDPEVLAEIVSAQHPTEEPDLGDGEGEEGRTLHFDTHSGTNGVSTLDP